MNPPSSGMKKVFQGKRDIRDVGRRVVHDGLQVALGDLWPATLAEGQACLDLNGTTDIQAR